MQTKSNNKSKNQSTKKYASLNDALRMATGIKIDELWYQKLKTLP